MSPPTAGSARTSRRTSRRFVRPTPVLPWGLVMACWFAGCAPVVGGDCEQNADCPADQTCAAAICVPGAAGTDAATPESDARRPAADTGALAGDARVSPPDARVSPPDAQILLPDARIEPFDAQVLPTDARIEPPDTQVQPTDAQTLPTDAQVLPTDAQVPPSDAQSDPPDAHVPCSFSTEICNGEDDDCDGEIDEFQGAPLFESCWEGPPEAEGVGECRGGVRICRNGAYGDCEGQILPAPEICDTRDNDCDDLPDDAPLGVGDACAAGIGACRAVGRVLCDTDLPGLICGAIVGQPEREVCNGEDDDCNGLVDDLPGVTSYGALGYQNLVAFDPFCDGVVDPDGPACLRAAHAYCVAQGCYAGGIGPRSDSVGGLAVDCLGDGVTVVRVTMAELATITPDCSDHSLGGIACRSAIHQRCATAGFETGYGPVAVGLGGLDVACIGAPRRIAWINPSWGDLGARQPTCGLGAGQLPAGLACTTAAHQLCREQGFAGGLWPIDPNVASARVACLRP